MPLGEIAGEALGGLFRILGHFLLEVALEGLVQGAGYWLIRVVRPKREPSDFACTIVGLAFWCVVGAGGYFLYKAYFRT